MTPTDLEKLKYPIGKFSYPGEVSMQQAQQWIGEIESLPLRLQNVVSQLSEKQLDTPYRPGGWTVRQVVHHIGDSHMNSLIRFKWALTEDTPTIKPYDEVGWANTAEYNAVSVSDALDFLILLHKKLVALLRSLDEADLQRSFNHPVSGTVKLGKNIGLYAWHGNHHLAHINELCHREGWNITHGQEEAN